MSLGLSTPTHAPSALEGALADLPLFELLSLLARANKSGTIYFAAAPAAAITLADGRVTFATCDPAFSLRELLLQRGIVTDVGWQQAIAVRDLDLGVALVRNGGVDSSQLQEAIVEQVTSAAHRISAWQDIEFRFVPGNRHVIGPGFSIDSEELRTLVAARAEAWALMADAIPSTTAVVRLASQPPRETRQLVIEADDWPVLIAIDGRRSIEELAIPARRGAFAVAEAVHRLLRAGLAAIDPR